MQATDYLEMMTFDGAAKEPRPTRQLNQIVQNLAKAFGEQRDGTAVALFTGVSGTGKTQALRLLAELMKLPIYRIDLAGVVNKYIGETEKHLSRLLDHAASLDCVLLFDEADALFGTRTDASDAHDRYANLDITYLLDKLENYEGPVLMTTNRRRKLDETLSDRFRFVL
ncbi:MAG: ATP-binding protein [candidate division Zixibacteria bacterium]|nr:ATP-binding protein [candidate division Zixibacteria bacterium]